MNLFEHEKRKHAVRNANDAHKDEVDAGGLNTKIAVILTKVVGTMWMAYLFAIIAVIGVFAIFGLVPAIAVLLIAWLSSQFLQLVLLPVIMVGQNVQGRKMEIQSDEMFKNTQNSYRDIEEVMKHLSAQDAELLKHTKMLENLVRESCKNV